ncbi:ATP-binding protein, partial [Streptomonospora algeriensis]
MKAARREFSPTPGTAAEARDFVRDTITEWGAEQTADDVVLLVSELVTNAVVHAESVLEVVVRRLPDAVEVVVADRVPERAVPQAGSLSVDTSPAADPGRSGGL